MYLTGADVHIKYIFCINKTVAKLCQILKTAWYTRRSLGGNFSPSSAVLDPRVGHCTTLIYGPLAGRRHRCRCSSFLMHCSSLRLVHVVTLSSHDITRDRKTHAKATPFLQW